MEKKRDVPYIVFTAGVLIAFFSTIIIVADVAVLAFTRVSPMTWLFDLFGAGRYYRPYCGFGPVVGFVIVMIGLACKHIQKSGTGAAV